MGIGFIDIIGDRKAVGWAAGDDAETPVMVELLADGVPIGETLADVYREDLKYVGYGDGRRGWHIEIPPDVWERGAALSARIKNQDIYLINNAEKDAKRHQQNFLNSTFNGLPDVECAFSFRAPDANDTTIAAEIIELSKQIAAYSFESGTMWDVHTKENQSDFARLLEREDAEDLAQFLVSFPVKRESTGFLQGLDSYRALSATDAGGLSSAEGPTKDVLVSLAQYLGIERLECAEVGPLGEALLLDQVELAERIEAKLGIPLAPPVVMSDLLGMKIGSGLLHRRCIQAVYAARRLLSVSEKAIGHLCEIGGGIGMAAYYAMRLGAEKYTIVDLPNMCLFQYYYLRRALPDRTVLLVTRPNQPPADVNIVPTSLFDRLGNAWQWDGILNCDSFPEMGDAVCEKYFDDFIGRAPILLSINQEANCPLTVNALGPRQPVVSQLLDKRDDYHRVYRFKSWARHGYAEELYTIGRTART